MNYRFTKLENSYAELPQSFYSQTKPRHCSAPKLIKLNQKLASILQLNWRGIDDETLAEIFTGNALLDNSVPIACAYAGHQFGHLAVLGDGRALLLGEFLSDNQRFDIALKGSGPTPYSRGGDGLAGLGPIMREYIVSEAMHFLNIPTSRTLAIALSGDKIVRESIQHGAVLTRIAASHLRIGTFTLFAAQGLFAEVKILADYVINRHYEHLSDRENKYYEFLREVMARQAKLIADWMAVGFIHGVMNTDNMTISGETIDYGPCAFMDNYAPDRVFSSIDKNGRYRYQNQPKIAQWNLARLAEALLPLLHDDETIALNLAQDAIDSFPQTFDAAWQSKCRARLGLKTAMTNDGKLYDELLHIMHNIDADYTITFRNLGKMVTQTNWAGPYHEWHLKWQQRLSHENYAPTQTANLIYANNPCRIARNHLVQAAISAAEENLDFSAFDELLLALENPFEEIPKFEKYENSPSESEKISKTFCGT